LSFPRTCRPRCPHVGIPNSIHFNGANCSGCGAYENLKFAPANERGRRGFKIKNKHKRREDTHKHKFYLLALTPVRTRE